MRAKKKKNLMLTEWGKEAPCLALREDVRNSPKDMTSKLKPKE